MNNWILDLSSGDKESKMAFLEMHKDDCVIMDLTCFNPNEFYQKYPQLKGVIASLLSHNNKCEAHFREHESEGIEFLKSKGLTPVLTTILTTGFVVPRTVATIVNEAFYALEDMIASKTDIDRAMKFGVNYPLGPFEWARGKERIVWQLLKNLEQETGNSRYKPCSLLEK